jgi:4-carboxymuconolactone decarboxylase
MHSRIAPLEPPYPSSVQEDFAKLMPPGMQPIALFRTIAHNPRVLGRFRRSGLLDPGSISIRERELVILRTTARSGSEYEWGVHVAFFAKAAGLTDRDVSATALGTADAFDERDRLLIRLADELHDHHTLGDALFDTLRARFDEGQLVELIALAGYYTLVSFMTNAARIPLEPGAPRFPRDLQVP